MRAAYHLGNRHVPIELQPDHLKIEPDHVLADMLRSMHMTVVEADLPFEPEGGAYGGHVTNDGHSHHHHMPAITPWHRPRHDHGHAPRSWSRA
jgi:urease accessory protein